MKNAVVVGANGFIGSVIVNKLIERGLKVYAVYNTNIDRINLKATVITNEEVLKLSLIPDLIFFLTGNYATPYSELLEMNNMLYTYVKKFPSSKLVYVSSANVYGDANWSIVENSPFVNPGTYALSKLAGEFIVQSLERYSIVRLAYVYGPKMTNTSFIPSLIKSARNHNKITLFGEGEREQDYIYVDDAADLCIMAANTHTNDIYLGATGKSTSNLEVANEIKKFINCEIVLTGTENASSFYFDPSLTFKKLNWKPATSLSQGIKNIVA
ncbi:NAD-dependent epimerase/dehydratase family protein [Kaistella polysaccharea]|uniref:NAD-dependent epimerase/dehydratase family protein n=1 Tax=Kaistella polysaccharea TaxID=2878534 RepID=UPI001CF41ED8|nr:NAD(P)-dependent oxidoreductase [Kaistella polysaccharea]